MGYFFNYLYDVTSIRDLHRRRNALYHRDLNVHERYLAEKSQVVRCEV